MPRPDEIVLIQPKTKDGDEVSYPSIAVTREQMEFLQRGWVWNAMRQACEDIDGDEPSETAAPPSASRA